MPEPKRKYRIKIEHRFSTRWNFSNFGALNGKHVFITAPNKSSSLFFNYKGTFSILLLALVDADYKFTCVDIGSYGSSCDGSIFKTSKLGQSFMNDDLDMLAPKPLPNFPEGGQVPHCIVADEAFPLCVNLMRPFPRGQRFRSPIDERVFNYRLSCACCIVENAFVPQT